MVQWFGGFVKAERPGTETRCGPVTHSQSLGEREKKDPKPVVFAIFAVFPGRKPPENPENRGKAKNFGR